MMKILLVEDNENQRQLLEFALKKRGYHVIPASDGNAGWAAFERENPPMVLVDWMMPGLSGIDLTRRIREHENGEKTAIIMLTAHDELSSLSDALAAGVDDYLIKPFNLETLNMRLHIAETNAERRWARLQSELELRAERDKLETVARNIGAGIAIISRDYKISWANNVLKTTHGKLEGMACCIAHNQTNGQCPDCALRKIFDEGAEHAASEQHSINREGQPIWSQTIATPIRDASGKVVEALELIVPITERKQAELKLQEYASNMEELAEERARQLVHADRLATLGTLAAGIAHEINNPCTFISANIQLFNMLWNKMSPMMEKYGNMVFDQRQLAAIAEVPKMLKDMEMGTQRIATIVKELKSYAGKRADSKQPCNLETCMDNALHLCHNRVKHTMNVDKGLDLNLPEVKANSQQLEQVFVNLIMNASDAVEERGTGNMGKLKISITATDDKVRLTFEDSGPGIKPERLEKLFTPFYTTKQPGKGTGLGLSISRGIIQEHGGTLEAGNATNEAGTVTGARFTITLPALAKE